MHYSDMDAYFAWEKAKHELLRWSNLSLEEPLQIDKLLLSENQKSDGPNYLTTSEVSDLLVNHDGIVWTRHHKAYRESNTRDRHIYPNKTIIEQERHIFAWTDHMTQLISSKLWAQVTSELLWWNMVLKRADGEDFYLDGLPPWTDFMVYSEGVTDMRDRTKFLINMKLVNFQLGCWTLWKSIAHELQDPSLRLKVKDASTQFRWAVLKIHGPQWKRALEAGQQVFVRIPTGDIV